MKKGKKTVLNKEKVAGLFNHLKTKGIVSALSKSSEVVGKSSDDKSEILLLAQSINNLAAGFMNQVTNQNTRIDALENKFKNRIDALPAPQISNRNEINKIVRNYADNQGEEFRDIWHRLYSDFDYRIGRQFSKCAKNRNMSTIDYIENEGLMGELLATAIDLFQEQS